MCCIINEGRLMSARHQRFKPHSVLSLKHIHSLFFPLKLTAYLLKLCFVATVVQHIGYLCVAARPLFNRGASPARTPGLDHLPAWHKMPCWWWQRTYSQTEKMWCCFKDLPEALGLHTGKEKILTLQMSWAYLICYWTPNNCDWCHNSRH